VIIFNSLCCC